MLVTRLVNVKFDETTDGLAPELGSPSNSVCVLAVSRKVMDKSLLIVDFALVGLCKRANV